MAKMLLVDSLNELRSLIDQQHLLYLEFDENPQKIEQRAKLENYIKEYLCLAPHDTKFTFQETADVLHQSVTAKSNFSAYKASSAWKAIGKYADNLISHPWRKEYRNIKLYCGFYKHEIEESLVGAELMFEAMGYKHTGHSSLSLPGILDPDRITSVSKDAILAYVECQIMKQIWETLSTQFCISWLEILEFRENHIGTPDQVIRSLTHKYCQKQYQEQMYHRQMQALTEVAPPSECLCRQNTLGYYNQAQYPGHAYSMPVQYRYGTVMSPTQAISPSSMYPPSIQPYAPPHPMKPQDIYSMNGHHRHAHYPAVNMPQYPTNGYQMEPPDVYLPQSVVPTGQLIEFDSSPPYNGSDQYFQRSDLLQYNPSQGDLLPHPNLYRNDEPSLSGKAKDDGAGSWENWDYVYRNLESHGYKKNLESSADLTLSKRSQQQQQQSSSQNNSSEIDISSTVQTEFSDKMKKLNLDRASQGESNSGKSCSNESEDKKSKQNWSDGTRVSSGDPTRDYGKAKSESKSSKGSPEKCRKDPGKPGSSDGHSQKNNIVYAKVNLSQKKDNNVVAASSITSPMTGSTGLTTTTTTTTVTTGPTTPTSAPTTTPLATASGTVSGSSGTSSTDPGTKPRNRSRSDVKPLIVNFNDEDDDDDKWQCVTCTYLNSMGNSVCEMCCKSKERGSEVNPQPTGGQECPTCTLVNKPGLTNCSACDSSLKNSPTYI